MQTTAVPEKGLLKYRPNILSTIGKTPLVDLSRFSKKRGFSVFGKLECFNPGGSIKDRTALNMLSQALESGEIKPGDTIIESSSGNMALGLAQACKFYHIKLIVVIDPKLNVHTEKLLKAYGVKLIKITHPKLHGGYLESRLQKVEELLAQNPSFHCLNQYENAANPITHYQTMNEIVHQLDQNVDYMFISTGTCGTLMGCAQYVYDNHLPTKIIAVDAIGSVIFGQKESLRLITGHGSGKPSNFLNLDLVDDAIYISDEESVQGCWNLLENEAILGGGSSGAVISAIEKYASVIADGSNCVGILCDRGERYLDTVYNKTWVKEHFADFKFPKRQNKETTNNSRKGQARKRATTLTVNSI
ncbi:2,3-diaminopropionate biosynthesis protein SbnA [Natronoflexus pectinivorans]|uniref:N-(2-amino-2-carboxyethyl)-L-glutamate synthase n=1 Tax=Natronoflexus pectinivorans TaxID=682526 RepID=A0A4R2GP18_9BACT|nr:2,3-diaminopropionate biosynthesis protein SbnA [Natronoflexus pectinivorans]TCO11085.1 cysteine synthase A [Natronoflexus pectinivorans]